MKNVKISLSVALIFWAAGSLSSQEKDSLSHYPLFPEYTIAVQPFYMVNGGLRFDFETQMRNEKEWMQYSLSGYYLSETDADPVNQYYSYNYNGWTHFNSCFEPISSLKGFGFGASYKQLFDYLSLYGSVGFYYNYYHVGFSSIELTGFVENDLTFYKYMEIDHHQNFHQFKPNVTLGTQSTLRSLFFYDAYINVAYNYALYDKNKYAFNDSPYGYGFRGITFSVGLRIGLGFYRR